MAKRMTERERAIAYHERLAREATPERIEQDRREMAARKAKALSAPTTRDHLAQKAAGDQAAEVVYLCHAASKPSLAADYIRRGLTLDQVKEELTVEGWGDKLVEARNRVV